MKTVYSENISKENMCFRCCIDDVKLAVAELSILPDNTWYFNRLNVPPEYRNKGIATKLMLMLIDAAAKYKITICCDINPYGDLNYDQLKKFYKKFGFVEDDVFDLKL